MKNFSKIYILIGLMLGLNFPAMSIETMSKFSGFQLNTCIEKKCLKLFAEKAESGQLFNLHSLINYKLSITEGHKTNNRFGNFGYIDFEKNIVTLKNINGSTTIIQLKNLKIEDYNE